MRSFLVAAAVAVLLLPVKSFAEDERATLDVLAGMGSTSTEWDYPETYKLTGGDATSIRAFLTVPVSTRFSVLGSYSMSGVDRGWLVAPYRGYFSRDKVSMGEIGFRIRF